jgi:RNA polymerase sigma-70 factor (ECF subfamily)
VAKARHDPEAFEELYRGYVDRIYRYLYSHVGEAAEAEDLTAQVFHAAWEGLDNYKERGEFSAWLFSIARNKAKDHYRQRRAHLSWEQVSESDHHPLDGTWDPQSDMEKNDDLDRLAGLLKQLKPHEMELIRLRFAADLSYREMAGLLRRSEASIKMAIHRLLQQLRKKWEIENA